MTHVIHRLFVRLPRRAVQEVQPGTTECCAFVALDADNGFKSSPEIERDDIKMNFDNLVSVCRI